MTVGPLAKDGKGVVGSGMVGLTVGVRVAPACVGDWVGRNEGVSVGFFVGDAVGFPVSPSLVGFIVGFSVG